MKVLVIATSSRTRGGITAVINAHKQGKQWDRYNCKWIETHIDSSRLLYADYLMKQIYKLTIIFLFLVFKACIFFFFF